MAEPSDSSPATREGIAAPAAPAAPTFEELLLPLLDAAYGVALHLTRNRADAEDLVQDAALLAFRAFGTFQPGTNFKAWFFRIIYNRHISRYRRRMRPDEMVGLEDASEFYILARMFEAGTPPQGSDPLATTIGRLQADEVSAALQALPEEYRAVCTMYFLEDFSYQEIADMLGIPVGTVRSRLHRGRKMLQKRLWQLAEDQGFAPRRAAAAHDPFAGAPSGASSNQGPTGAPEVAR